MKTLVSAVSTGALVLGAEVAYAGGPGWKILGIGINFWIILIVILLILNLLCCWLKK
jgi:TM2 domain-containing membrane protein YozV